MAALFSTPEGNSGVLSSFRRDFILTRMRMSHIYQPVMIRELLKSAGKASIRNIGAAFLSRGPALQPLIQGGLVHEQSPV